MAQMQKRVSRGRRFFGWFGRHKVTAVFAALFAGLLLYLVSSWLVLQIQIHFERERFMRMDAQLAATVGVISGVDTPQISSSHMCSYTNNGAVFAFKRLGCGSHDHVLYKGVTSQEAKTLLGRVKDVVINQGIILIKSDGTSSGYDLAVYGFESHGIECSFTSAYYNDSVPAADRYSGAPSNGDALFIALDCSGAAKAEYFPVVKH